MALVAVVPQCVPKRQFWSTGREHSTRLAGCISKCRRIGNCRAAISVGNPWRRRTSSLSRKMEEWEFDPLDLGETASVSFIGEIERACGTVMQAISNKPKQSSSKGIAAAIEDSSFDLGDFFKGRLPNKFLLLLGWLALSRVGTYIPLPGVNRAAFSSSVDENSLFRTLDAFSGGGIGRLGISSLGIVPFINAQILFQLLGSLFPELEKLQKKEGEAGRKKVLQYTRYVSVGFAIFQALGQVFYIKPYVDDFSLGWAFTSVSLLTIGAVTTTYIGERISDIKLGNGTSLLIFTNIVSSLPASIGRTTEQALKDGNYNGLGAIAISFFLLVLGIVYVQESERRIPLNYASRYTGLQKSAYLPFKINSSGVMPIIFSTSALALTSSVARFTGGTSFGNAVAALNPGGSLYLPTNAVLIAFFNYFYTFLQLDPSDVSDQLKRQGASIPSVRPGKATAAFIEAVLTRISVLDSTFLVIMAVSPAAVEWLTHLTAFRGFAGTSILILVGCATDTARKVKAELISQKYKVLDFYDNGPSSWPFNTDFVRTRICIFAGERPRKSPKRHRGARLLKKNVSTSEVICGGENSCKHGDQMVRVCDICREARFEEMLAVCSKCIVAMEHMYCMQEFSGVPVWEGKWLCERCKPSAIQKQTSNSSTTKARLAYDSLPSFLLNSRPKESLERLERRKTHPPKTRQSSGLRPIKQQDDSSRPEKTSQSSNEKHIKGSPDVSSLSELQENPSFKVSSLSERNPNAPTEKDACAAGVNRCLAPSFWAQPQIPVWRGTFEVVLSGPAATHASTRALHKALELCGTLPSSLELHPAPRLSCWPQKFRRIPPNDEEIRYEAQYSELLERVMRFDVLFECFLSGAKLIIAPSKLLIPPFQFWKSCGIFQRVSIGAATWASDEDMDCHRCYAPTWANKKNGCQLSTQLKSD